MATPVHLSAGAGGAGAAPDPGINPGPLSSDSVTWFFREVMSACLSLEQPLGVAFLGPLGTFSESAATKHFGHAARLLPQLSIDDVFREVEACHADFAVVPIENSTEGAIGRTLDLLMTTPAKSSCASTSTS